MKRLFFLWMLLGGCLLVGCGEKVEFTALGKAVCPYCKKEVQPHSEFCLNCKQTFRWADELVRCWSCKGTKVCSSCKGAGVLVGTEEEKCQACNGTGYCQECDRGGYVEYGQSPIPVYVHRTQKKK